MYTARVPRMSADDGPGRLLRRHCRPSPSWFKKTALFPSSSAVIPDGRDDLHHCFPISEIVEYLLQQTHFPDNNGFNIQFLDSKAEFSHLESCALSSARRSWEENRLHDNDNQFFLNPDLIYHQQDQLQRDMALCCRFRGAVDK
jgi:hypothetical protein